MKPQNLKQAIERDYIFANLYDSSPKIRVDLKPRFADENKPRVSFWIDRAYFKRNYPNTFKSHIG